jgi:predicted Zn-ribbon and HTH transcriptional regulator
MTMTTNTAVRLVSCRKCGWRWAKRVEKPAECPACKSRGWGKK